MTAWREIPGNPHVFDELGKLLGMVRGNAASMHKITRPRRLTRELVDRAPDPVPDPSPFHVAGGHQFIGALCGV